jgi:hypothetical protein
MTEAGAENIIWISHAPLTFFPGKAHWATKGVENRLKECGGCFTPLAPHCERDWGRRKLIGKMKRRGLSTVSPKFSGPDASPSPTGPVMSQNSL